MTRRERARRALEALRQVIPRPETELDFQTPYELLVAVILSAQCTDRRVNEVTPALFGAFPDVGALAGAEPEQVFPFIRSVSYPNQKAKHLVGMARRVLVDFGGSIPESMEGLISLPGVGRKTAQVVLSVAFEQAALPVDTHVFRVANRIGIAQDADTPLKVERQLKEAVPEAEWSEAHHLLILHGRYTCTARSPRCPVCPVAPVCLYYQRLAELPASLEGLNPRQGKYYCKSRRHYFDVPVVRPGSGGSDQFVCPKCGSRNVFESRTGRTLQRVADYRV